MSWSYIDGRSERKDGWKSGLRRFPCAIGPSASDDAYPGGNRGNDQNMLNPCNGFRIGPLPHASACFSQFGFLAPLGGARDRGRRAIHVRRRCFRRQCCDPDIAVELHASAAQIEAVIAIYLIAYATLVVTGGRLGDIYGIKMLIEGCAIQVAGLAILALTVASVDSPAAAVLALVLMIFGYGLGLAMAPLSSAVLSTVNPASAGSGSGMYGTTAQIANAAGVAAIGAAFFAIEAATSARLALFCGFRAVYALDHHQRRIPVMDAARCDVKATLV
jgi:hypothetical protein